MKALTLPSTKNYFLCWQQKWSTDKCKKQSDSLWKI